MGNAKPPPESAGVASERRLRRVGFIVVVAIFGGFGLWAAVAPLSSAAIGQGVISVEQYRKTVQHLEGGIVREIRAVDGQLVASQEVLLTLDDTQPKAQLQGLRGQFFALLARESRLVAQRDGMSQVVFPPRVQQLIRIFGYFNASRSIRINGLREFPGRFLNFRVMARFFGFSRCFHS